MIAHLEGTLVEKHPTQVILDVGGVGYEVFVPLSTFERLPDEKARCRLLIYDYVREDAHLLFGFSTEAERDLFRRLLDVRGVGPKLALSALSGLSVREFTAAVAAGDVRRLSAVPGIGKKTAERLVVELRDKISAGEALEAIGRAEARPEDLRLRDATLALISLGYKQTEALEMIRRAARDAPAEATVEDLVRRALAG